MFFRYLGVDVGYGVLYIYFCKIIIFSNKILDGFVCVVFSL